MKFLKYSVLLSIFAPALSIAITIPKVDLVTCEVNKDDIASFFYSSDSANFQKAKQMGELKLQQVNLAGQPGIADFYKFSIKLVDQAGKVIPGFQKSLEQVSINYGPGVISAGYSPYSVARTSSEPFALLIEEKNKAGDANGFLNVVPLQSSSASPMKQIQMNCKVNKAPSAPISITPAELLKLQAKDQFEVVYNLFRIGHTDSSFRDKEKNLEAFGLSTDKLAQVKKDMSALLSSRALPALTSYQLEKQAEVVTSSGDRCGNISIGAITPVYDSLSVRKLRDSKDATLRKQALGYILSYISCELTARTLTMASYYEGGEKEVYSQKWRAENVMINSQGVISSSFNGGSVYLSNY